MKRQGLRQFGPSRALYALVILVALTAVIRATGGMEDHTARAAPTYPPSGAPPATPPKKVPRPKEPPFSRVKMDKLGKGAWSYFGDPRAVHYEGTRHLTYTGWTNRKGNIVVSAHGPGYEAVEVIGHLHVIDDHINPSLIMRPDGRLMAFFANHNGRRFYYRITKEPENIERWGKIRRIYTNTRGGRGWTYPNPVYVGKRLYVFWRGGDWQPTYSRIVRNKRWARARTLIRTPGGDRPYVKYAPTRGKGVLVAFNRSHPREGNSSLYFAKFKKGGLFRASGRRIARRSSLPIRPRLAEKIHSQRKTGLPSWVQDVAATPHGRPVIVYSVFPSPRHHQYRYARWNGHGWKRSIIVRDAGGTISTAREGFYSAGITLDHRDPSIVYLSRKVGRRFEIEMWRTPNKGRTWSRTPITSNSPTDNVRPISPRGLSKGESEVIWLRGRYGHYRTYHTKVYTKSPWEAPLSRTTYLASSNTVP